MANYLTTEWNCQKECLSFFSRGSVVVDVLKYNITFVFYQIRKEMRLLFFMIRTLELRTVCLAADNERRHRDWWWLYPSLFLMSTICPCD